MNETVDLTDCTLSDNSSQDLGGGVSIEGGGTVNLTACTISSNTTTGQGGGIANEGTATLTDTIVAGNSSGTGDDIDGDTVTGSFNLVGTDSVGLVNGKNDNIVGVSNPVLAALGNYGGQTETMAVLPGSPAIGAGSPVSGITSDQRGEPLASPIPDIGAFQSQGFVLAPVAGSTPQSTMDESAFPNPTAVTIKANNPVEPVAGGVIGFAAPTSGASAQLSATAATVGSNGVASVTATANATAGSYTVTASAPGVGSLDFDLTNNLIPLSFSGPADQSITYGTPSVTIPGTLADGSLVPQGQTVAVTLDGIQQSATINSDGAFSTVFNTSSLGVSGSPYTVTCVYTSDGNFASASTTSKLAVTQATPTVTWHNPAAITYGAALGATELDATASVPGTFTYTPSAGTVLTAGSGQTLSVSFIPTDTTDYTTASATVTMNVHQATPAITWANPAAITYGTALSSAQLDATASVPGTFIYTPALGTVLPAGDGQTLSVSFVPTDTKDYTAATAKVTMNVHRATPSITWANPAAITHGTALSSAQLDATASVPGVFTYIPALGTVLPAGSGESLSVSFAPTDTTDYTTAAAKATINVDQAAPAITWANPADITYGTALSSAQLDATASVPGTFTYTPALGTVLSTRNGQTLSVSFAPTNAADYTTAAATATINVDQATPAITWANPAEITYGTALSSTQLDAMASWAVNGSNQPVAGTYTYNPAAGEVLSVGNNQTLSVSFTPSDTTDYSGKSAAAMINVDQATPAITWADPADITHGTALSSAQLDATASVPGTFTYAPALGTVLPAGSGEKISVSFAPTNATDYTTVTATATINVDRAAPAITWANPAAITYGTALSSAQLDATASVPGTFTYTPATGTALPAGNGQTLSVSFAPTDNKDYTTAGATATINVDRATPTLHVSAAGGVYNGTPFPVSLTIDGITHSPGTALEGVIPTLAYYVGSSTSGMSLGPTPPTDAGTYTVVASFAGSTDYASTRSSPSTFTIVRSSATFALTSSGGLAVFGQTVTFFATVETPSAPAGTVTFSDDGTPLATIPLSGSGQATLAITSLAPGSHAITATYSGDADILGVQSSATALSVAPDGTRVVLVPQPIFKKKKMVLVGLKAEIEPLSPGGGLPTGTVVFELTKKHRKKLKVKTLGTTAVNGGAATLTLKPQKVLKKAITIVYSGNDDFLASQLISPKLTKKQLKRLAQPLS